MKVAVIFYGRISKFRETYHSFSRVFGETNPDIFYSCDNEDEIYISEFKELYRPIAVCNEKINYSVNFGVYPGLESQTNIHNMTCHFINKMRVFELMEKYVKESGTVYDLVLSTRLDIIYISPIILSEPANNCIYIPDGWDYSGLNDQIAYGNMAVMDIYMNIFINTELFLKKNKSKPHPESLNNYNIIYNGIDVVRFPLKYYIIREVA